MCFCSAGSQRACFTSRRVLETVYARRKALNIETEAIGAGLDSQKIDEEIRKPHTQQARTSAQKPVFYSEAAAMFQSHQTAWRNPTMHVENFYDGEKAWDVTAVRSVHPEKSPMMPPA